ncbi:MAG TPA: MoxR family ATPase, partial [Thermomicrobiales bacterium]|nr:MoxR family ATPase [Thermomicrobiales bacterium]
VSETVAPTAGQRSLLADLGLFGVDAIEPLILAGLVSEEPILLIGAHGTGKSLLFVRLADALGLAFRHYNASLLNYDDLVGYPLPDGNGGLDYVQTPATVWGSQAVFIDEISRCRPDMQNKLFPIIHEKRVQGMALDKLIYRWSAMNPPAGDEEEDLVYLGSEALDPALADRFALVITMPDWSEFSEQDQVRVILADSLPVSEAAAGELRGIVAAARDLVPNIREMHGPALAVYVRALTSLLERSGTTCSARRAGMLLRNVIAVHAVRHVQDPNATLSDSAYLALGASLPHPAYGVSPKPLAVHAAHREAWRMAGVGENDALRLLLAERDPLRRALRAIQLDDISRADLSGVVADALAALPPGARHALAAEIFARDAAGRLVAAVAEQCADLYATIATAQNVHESVAARGGRHALWQHVIGTLAQLDPAERENVFLSNLITGLFASDDLATAADLERVIATWQSARGELAAAA